MKKFFVKNVQVATILFVLLSWSLAACGGKDPVAEDLDLVGSAWQGIVSTKDTNGNVVEVSVGISFLGNSLGRWHFEDDPAAFLFAWNEKKSTEPMAESKRFSTFTYSRSSKKILGMRDFRVLFEFLSLDWIITEFRENSLSLVSRADDTSRTIWIKLKRIA